MGAAQVTLQTSDILCHHGGGWRIDNAGHVTDGLQDPSPRVRHAVMLVPAGISFVHHHA